MDFNWYTSSLTLIWVDYAILVISVLFTAVNYKRFDPDVRWLVWLLWFALAIESGSKLYLLHWVPGSNHYLLHLYTIGEFWLLSYCYRDLLQLSPTQREKFTYTTLALGTIISTYSVLCLLEPERLPSESVQWYNKVVVNAALMVYSSWLFARIIQSPGKFRHLSRGVVMLNSGVLLYYSATFLLFLTFEFLVEEAFKQTLAVWFCYTLLIFVLHITMLRSVWLLRGVR